MMIDQPLIYIDGATEGTTQWKAETLQVVNWGGFQGHHQVSLSPTSTLLSGASGTGKSTLLDAYLALMMPSDTPFNGASTDATSGGRARGAEQRNLVRYLKGKTDTALAAGTDDLQDTVLRGGDSPTWGAVAMTFVNDNGLRHTALRVYYVPRGVTRSGEVNMKMAATDGFLGLDDLESLAGGRFDKRALKARFPDLKVYDTYVSFAAALHTRLGIGANGDGGKALRLLARIQAGRQVRTVDGLYKSMVLEEPATYAAAEKATDHFSDLETSYEAMVTEDQKAKVLELIPTLHGELEEATENAALLDTFGVNREGDTPFYLWSLRTESDLLSRAVDQNRADHRIVDEKFRTAKDKEVTLKNRLRDVQQEQRDNNGDALTSLQTDLDELVLKREVTLRARNIFDQRVEPLAVPVGSAQDLFAAQTTAEAFLKTFDQDKETLEGQRKAIHDAQYPLEQTNRELKDELKSLSGRDGLVPARLHNVRLLIAEATGINATNLPFLAELIDVAPGQERWRKAAEVTLAAAATIMLVDQEQLDHLSRTIDPLRLPTRVHFEGVELQPHRDVRTNPDRISGKLLFKDSPFSGWVQDRVQAGFADHLCVEHPTDLRGGGPRVTVAGQTRNGKRGAHGEMNTPNIIGFSNKARLVEIGDQITVLTGQLENLSGQATQVGIKIAALSATRDAHRFLLDTLWSAIDVATVEADIDANHAERDRILSTSDVLRTLKEEEGRLTPALERTSKVKVLAEKERETLDQTHADLADRQDIVGDHIERIDRAQNVSLSQEHTARLDAEFAADQVGTTTLASFPDGVTRLRKILQQKSMRAREEARKATDSLTRTFAEFQARWPDPNLGVALASYPAYWAILDNILTTGLHGRRNEWKRRLSAWSGEDLVPLNGAFESSIQEIIDRLTPVNEILSTLEFGAGHDRLQIRLRRLHGEDITKLRAELKHLSSGISEDLTDEQAEAHFTRLREFMNLIRKREDGTKGAALRDTLLDVRKHVEITAVRVDRAEGIELSRYSSLEGEKSGGENQELIAFIVGAALRFQLGDESLTRPRFAPVFLDEGFVKADAEFAGRSVAAWKGLGFQLIIGVPLDKVNGLEPHMDVILSMTKNPKTGYSYITPVPTIRSAVA